MNRESLAPLPDTGLLAVEEFDSGLLQNRDHPAQRFGARGDRTVELLHPRDRPQGHLGFFRQLRLRPAEQPSPSS